MCVYLKIGCIHNSWPVLSGKMLVATNGWNGKPGTPIHLSTDPSAG